MAENRSLTVTARNHAASYRAVTVRERSSRAGVTLIEMVIVVALMGLIAAISFPSVNSGLDSIRLMAATDSVVSFLNAGLNRAQRRQQPIEIVISIAENYLSMQSVEPGFLRRLEFPQGVKVLRIHPELPDETARSFVLYPAGAIPRFGVELINHRGVRRIVRVDPITGVPQVEDVEP